MTTLVVTNDFPPRIGGIESFVASACDFLDGDVVVLTSATAGSATWDRALPYEVVRVRSPLLVPDPLARRAAVHLLRRTGATRVLFGAAAPLAVLAGALRRAGAERLVAMTHGHETWWATVPGTRRVLRRIGEEVDALSTISDYVARRLTPALSAAGRAKLFRLPPPVDGDLFRPPPTAPTDRPTCVAVARFVRRKGLDRLLAAWRVVLRNWPGAADDPQLVLVGDGPQGRRLRVLVRRWGLRSTVSFTGAVPRPAVAGWLQRGRVFALPVRTRHAGLEPEGLGLAAVEAAACGLPVVVGDSGGAPETVVDGVTGYVVPGDDTPALAQRIGTLLHEPERVQAMGTAGRAYALERFGAQRGRQVLRRALTLP